MDTQDAFTISPWHRWEERKSFDGCDQRGIYIIGKFQTPPDQCDIPAPDEVFYIGETHGKSTSLRKRLHQFSKAALDGMSNHAGGRTYHSLGMDPDFTDTYFAVVHCEISLDQKINTAWIYHVERLLIWRFAEKHGRIPACNSE